MDSTLKPQRLGSFKKLMTVGDAAIAQLIANITSDRTLLKQFVSIDLPPIKQWTEEEALKMRSQNYRDTYLN